MYAEFHVRCDDKSGWIRGKLLVVTRWGFATIIVAFENRFTWGDAETTFTSISFVGPLWRVLDIKTTYCPESNSASVNNSP
jgi:hypothetical protein